MGGSIGVFMRAFEYLLSKRGMGVIIISHYSGFLRQSTPVTIEKRDKVLKE
jgi:hypothetical protein